MSERIKPQIMVQHVEFLQRCLDGNLPALTTLHEICTEIAWLRGDVDVKWQSRALAAEQTLKQRDEEIVDREKIQQEQLKMLLEAEQERDQLKAELQQAREAVGFNPHFDFDDEVRFILGRPGFTVREFAETLRAGGCYQCAKKHEDEQAVAIHWMLTLYRKHGLEWRAKGDAEIRAILERIEKEKK